MNQNSMRPSARALIKGGEAFPEINGEVLFYQRKCAIIVAARVSGLPKNDSGFYGFHIHEGDCCEGEDFQKSGSHYNPKDEPHPKHSGDLPPLLFCSGSACMEVKTDRFNVREIIGRTVIIHNDADDFHTQPSGGAGEKIACGVIRRV